MLVYGTLSPVITTHLGWSIQVGFDKKAKKWYVVVDGVKQSDLPSASKAVTHMPDLVRSVHQKINNDFVRSVHPSYYYRRFCNLICSGS